MMDIQNKALHMGAGVAPKSQEELLVDENARLRATLEELRAEIARIESSRRKS
jgi:hypothetical protein